MSGPLEGIRVLDLSAVVSGPFATSMLSDQGADVIKVEPIGIGDIIRYAGPSRGGMTSIFAVCNRGKRSLSVDLRSDRGREIVHDLAVTADVVVQNFRPGVVDRMGIGYDDLKARNANLIYVSISGFGESGPYAQKRVYDPLIQLISGMAAVQRNPEAGEPDLVRNIVCDKVTSLTVAQSVVAALFGRERGKGGQHIRLSMLDAAIAFLWPDGMASHTFLGDGVAPMPNVSDVYRLSKTADGYMTSIVLSDAEFHGLCRAAGKPELAEDARFKTLPDRAAHIEEFMTVFSDMLEGQSTEEICARLDAEDVPCAPLVRAEDVHLHPQVVENGILVEHDHPLAGRMRQPRPAARFEGTPAEIQGPAPALGEHTDALLRELGRSEAAIAQLRAENVVA